MWTPTELQKNDKEASCASGLVILPTRVQVLRLKRVALGSAFITVETGLCPPHCSCLGLTDRLPPMGDFFLLDDETPKD